MGKWDSGLVAIKDFSVGSLVCIVGLPLLGEWCLIERRPNGNSQPPGKILFQSMPASQIILLQKRRIERKAGRVNQIAALKHEGQRIVDALRRQGCAAGFLEG